MDLRISELIGSTIDQGKEWGATTSLQESNVFSKQNPVSSEISSKVLFSAKGMNLNRPGFS